MISRSTKIQSEAFTGDLTAHMEAAQRMYPGGRFQRAFDRIFRRGMVEMADTHHAMVLADRAQREAMDEPTVHDDGRQHLPAEAGKRTMRETVLADLYARQDAGAQLPPGLIAQHEGNVQEERLAAAQGRPVENPFQPDMTGVLPAGGVIDGDLPPVQQTSHDIH